jgi:putative PEP-CTERM system histidine kinase
MPFSISDYAYTAALLAYGAFATLLAFRSARSWITSFLILAAGTTAAWAGTMLLVEWLAVPSWAAGLTGTLRDGFWFAVVLAVLYTAGRDKTVWLGLIFAAAAASSLHALFSITGLNAGTALGIALDSRATGLLMVIVGLMLVDNMMRNLSRDQFWSAKFLGIGLIGVLLFQFLVRVPEFLTGSPEERLLGAFPFVYLLVLPLFVVTAVRSPSLQLRIHSSRKIVFHTTALIAAGILLQGTAIAAYYVRTYGGDNATVLSIVLGFGGAMGVAVAAASTGARSRLRMFINENFFSYKYDYRLEWDKFIRALSSPQEGDVPLRALRTLAETLDSSGGALWLMRERWHQFMPVAQWSFRDDFVPVALDDSCLAAFMSEDRTHIELTSSTREPDALLWQSRYPSGWLAIPLRYRSTLIGVALLNQPRAARKLDWEDGKLISLVALQLAAYLVQDETAQALADARQLEEFNKRFAFIVHDVKNTIGQLSLLVRNVEVFGHNEEFRRDMIVTLRNSVEKLQELLAQLKGETSSKASAAQMEEWTNMAALVSNFVKEKCRLGLNVAMPDGALPLCAELPDQKAFITVLEHVVTNATEAAPEGSAVNIRVLASGASIRVTVEDRGRGMTNHFIANELFRPLRTMKRNGFGIGAYQAREIMRDLGGDIEVFSKVGEGTTVSLLLPVAVPKKELARA